MPNDYWDTLDIDGDERPIADATARLSLAGKMDKVNPTGSGALSINREDNTTVGDYSAAEGYSCEASGEASHGEGSITKAQGDGAHSEGVLTQAIGNGSHAEGYASQTSDNYSHAEGQETLASGIAAHAEGYNTEAGDDYSHAEGSSSVASGKVSHAEGMNCIASGDNSHAEGLSSRASGLHSHAEGSGNTASGLAAHAEGRATQASGTSSHAEGQETLASSANQHVSGKYNIEDNQDTFAEIIGNGSGTNNRSNARTLDWQGNERLAGGLTINAGTASETNIGTALGGKVDKVQGKGLSTEDYTTAEKTKLAGLPSTIPSTADDISYDPTTSGMTSTNVQDALDELASEKADAATLSPIATSGEIDDAAYDNTSSGLNATNGQDAIDELASGKQDALTAGNNVQISGSTISATDTKPTNHSNVGTGTESVSNNTWTDIWTISDLPAGYYIVQVVVAWQSSQNGNSDNGTGYRQIEFRDTDTSAGSAGWVNTNNVQATSGIRTCQQMTLPIRTTSTTTYKLSVRHNAGSTIYAIPRIRYVKIG